MRELFTVFMKNIKIKSLRTYSWMLPKTEIRDTEKYSKGVFAKSKIKKDEIVAISGGYIMKRKEVKKLPQDLEFLSFQIEKDFFIGIKKYSEMEDCWRFNHSCDPNIGVRGQVSLVAMRDIKANEELVFDYATTLYREKGNKPFRMKCKCGSRNCRKVVTDDDWKIKKLQKKYHGYFQLFINSEIRKK